jgi:hypothetical protein
MRDGTYSSTPPAVGNTCGPVALTDDEETFAGLANASRADGLRLLLTPTPRGTLVLSASSSRPRPLLRERNHCMTLRALLVLAGISCPRFPGARGTLPLPLLSTPAASIASLSDVDVGSAVRGSRDFSRSREGVSGPALAELRPGRALIVRAIGSTMTLSVLLRFFFAELLSVGGLNNDVCVVVVEEDAAASTVGLTDDGDVEGATCKVDGRREVVDPDIFEMVV